jgi:hypothetical protein
LIFFRVPLSAAVAGVSAREQARPATTTRMRMVSSSGESFVLNGFEDVYIGRR